MKTSAIPSGVAQNGTMFLSYNVRSAKTFYLFAFLFCLALSSAPCALSQTPQGFNYQALAFDNSGELIRNQALPVRITIQSDSLGGTIFWYEEHAGVMTNPTGLFSLILGKGSKISGTASTFADIDWSVTPKFIKTEIDYGGWKDMGSSQMWSVPYAMRASGITGSLPAIDVTGSSRIGNHQLGYTNLEVNYYGTGNRYAFIDLHGDDTYTDYGLRLIRANTGPDAYSSIIQRGLGPLNIATHDSASLDFFTRNSRRMRITPVGNVGIGNSTPLYRLDVNGQVTARDYNAFRLRRDTYSAILRNDGESMWVLTTAENDPDGSYGTLRPLRIMLASGNVHLGNNRLNILHGGNVGIGTLNPMGLLHVASTTGMQQITAGQWSSMSGSTGGIGLFGTNAYMDTDNKVKAAYTHATLGSMGMIVNRPSWHNVSIFINDPPVTQNTEVIPNYVATFTKSGLGIGTTTPGGRLSIQTPATWDDNTPLFEVKNKLGVPVFAVYNYGVRILVDHTTSKAVKGGFAIGGFDETKAGETVTLMLVSPDSIRFNINNTGSKAVKGGFAIGGFDETKGPINEDFMYITPKGSSSGEFNTFIGHLSGNNITSGKSNVFIGENAGFGTTTGGSNTFIGYRAGYSPNNMQRVVAIGYEAGYGTSAANYLNSVLIGNYAGRAGGGGYSVIIGNNAGEKTTGGFNVFLGPQAGQNITTGNNNIYIGALAGKDESITSSNKLIIAGSLGTVNLITGDFGNQRVVIRGQNNPNSRTFFVNGAAGGTTVWYNDSDERLKKNIAVITDPVNKVLNLRGVEFEWIDSENHLPGRQIGFIAQEVMEVVPEVVDNTNGHFSMSYAPLTALIVEAMKEQQHIIVSLEEKIKTQQTELETLRTEMESIKALLLREIK